VQALAKHIAKQRPGSRGFSAQNLWRMRQFYDTYSRQPKLSALLRELSWTHNLLIMGKCKRDEEREFYFRDYDRLVTVSLLHIIQIEPIIPALP
jgi:hypothetical protein